MKEIYLKPEVQDLNMELEQMIALSKLGNADPEGEVLSREAQGMGDDSRNSIWDDDEDEEW